MAGLLIVPSYMPALDSNGRPSSGALLTVFNNRTTTKAAIFSDPALVVPLLNPVPADTAGVFPLIYVDGSVPYSTALETAAGKQLKPPYDDIYASIGSGTAGGFSVIAPNSATPDADVKTAFAGGLPTIVGAPCDLIINPTTEGGATVTTRGAYVAAAFAFINECSGITPRLLIEDGLHLVNGTININGGSPIELRAKNGVDLLTISSLAVVNISGTTYEVTVGLTTALRAGVSVGWPAGLQNIRGNNHAKAFNGGGLITAIAGDRLSFKYRTYFNSLPTAPTAITTGVSNGVAESRVIIPRGAIVADGAGRDGTANEGWLNVFAGASVTLTYIGVAYTNSGEAYNGDDLLFARDSGSSIRIADYAVCGGAEDRVLRLFSSSQGYLQNCCLFGGGATEAVLAQDFVSGTVSRASVGGFSSSAFTANSESFIGMTDTFVGGCGKGLFSINNSKIEFYQGYLSFCDNAAYVDSGGAVRFDTGATIENNNIGLNGTSGTFIGSPVFSGNTLAVNTQIVKQVKLAGLEWIADETKGTAQVAQVIAIANNAVVTIDLAGASGTIEISPVDALPGHAMLLGCNIATRTGAKVYAGTAAEYTAGPLSGTTGTGSKINACIYDNSGTAQLQVNNNATGGTVYLGITYHGNLRAA